MAYCQIRSSGSITADLRGNVAFYIRLPLTAHHCILEIVTLPGAAPYTLSLSVCTKANKACVCFELIYRLNFEVAGMRACAKL